MRNALWLPAYPHPREETTPVIPLDLIPLDLIPLDLLPLDIPPDAPRPTGFGGFLPLLGIVLVALVVMVAVLFYARSRRGKK